MPTRAQVCAWIAATGLIVPSVEAQDRTERDVIELIVEKGPRAQAIRVESDVVRREQFARLAVPNPTLSYSREGAGFTEFVQAEQTLPLVGTRSALSRAGVAATAAAEAEQDARLWQLRSDAAAAVTMLTTAQVQVEAAQAHTRDVERLIEILRTREREGEGSRFDRLRAEQELRDARQRVTGAAVDLATARSRLAAMLPPQLSVGRVTPATHDPRLPGAVDSLISRALSARAELRALQRAADRADFEADAARRARLPAPTVFGGWKRADAESGRDRGGVFGVNVPLPLFDNGSRDAASWAAVRIRAEAERASIERLIRAEITEAFEILSLRDAILADDTAAAGDDLVEIAEVAYREGEAGILELLDAFRTAVRARLRTIELRRDARLAQIALERAVGEALWP